MDKFALLANIDDALLDAFGLGMTLARLPFYFRMGDVRQSNRLLKSYRNSDRVYVCGLGPSFRDVDMSRIDGDTIVTNRFALYDDVGIIRPTYYCLFDKAFFGDARDFTKAAVARYQDTAFVFDGKNFKQYDSLLAGKNANLFYAFMWAGRCKRTSSFDFERLLPTLGNVVCGAIALAIYCGYREIILLGCDFNSFASQTPLHCYREEGGKSITLGYELFVYSFVSKIHEQLGAYAKDHGIVIRNATPGSLIDAYAFDTEAIKGLYAHE